MDLVKAFKISAAGMKAQSTRLRVIAENMANANSLGDGDGTPPYRRKVITFRNVLDRALGAQTVRVGRIAEDKSDFPLRYDPHHPAADGDGYVKTPNVNSLMEMMDMREAQRSYSANLRLVDASKKMIQRTIDILR